MKYLVLALILLSSVAWSQSQPATTEQSEQDAMNNKKQIEEIKKTDEPTPQIEKVPEKAPEAKTSNEGISLIFGGSIYFALENWSRVGTSGDSKMGFGFGGDFGIGMKIDDLNFFVGPHLGLNRWSADYSQKSQSATDSVYVEMADTGINLTMDWGDMYINMGTGSSTISSGMIVSGQDIKYSYSGDQYSYTLVGLGMNMDRVLLGLNTVNYSGYAKYADRIEILIGYRF